MSSNRVRKLTPWYHEPKPRCVTQTLEKEQCSYSASYQDATGQIKVCKIHADMMEKVRLIKIRPKRVDIKASRAVST